MILTFSEDKFEERIKAGTKYTTFREDKHNRWDVGMKIHFWRGNPRNTHSKNKPHSFGTGEVIAISMVLLNPAKDSVKFRTGRSRTFKKSPHILNHIAVHDGFDDWMDMKKWFVDHGKTDPKGYWMKKIYFKYDEPVQS